MRQSFIGLVISTAMQKTVRVRVARRFLHPKVQKMVVKYKNYMAHDEKQDCLLGDMVRIEACRPLSKHKSFTISHILQRKNSAASQSLDSQ